MNARRRTLLEEVLSALGIAATTDARDAIEKLVERPDLLVPLMAAAAQRPVDADLPDVDRLVGERLQERYASCIEPRLLVKPQRVGGQNRRLLAYLLARLGRPVPLVELLAANGFHSATPRRLRELRWEHGGWRLETSGRGLDTTYVLHSAEPDLDASAYYWLKRNIRQSDFGWDRKLVALLSARLGEPVPVDDLAYVLPHGESAGRGRARTAPVALTRRIRQLRELGYQVQSGLDRTHAGLASSDYVLPTLERLPEYERLPAKVRDERLKIDGYRCTQCGWGPEQGPSGGRKLLEVHHGDPQRARPKDVHDLANLRTLCNVCHRAK